MIKWPTVNIFGADGSVREVILIQGGMGVWISLAELASAVVRRGVIGTISSAVLDLLWTIRSKEKVPTRDATRLEIEKAKIIPGFYAINIMAAIAKLFPDSIRGALDAKVDAIISGAGLPLSLPVIVDEYGPDYEVALVPIVSSAQALRIIAKRWERQGRVPDAVVLEGPLAGGHLGFSHDQLDNINDYSLERIFPDVKKVAESLGNIPVIVAGGIMTNEDIIYWKDVMGADGVQMATVFLATEESGASASFKQAVVACQPEDIIVPRAPGSGCGYPFRLIRTSPGFRQAQARLRRPHCSKGYVLQKNKQTGLYTDCLARIDDGKSFCVCNTLIGSAGRPEYADGVEDIYTVGARAGEIDRIKTVDEVMDKLLGVKK